MNIIGLLGYAGSGKDTVADMLVQKYNYKKFSFADPIKEAVSSMFGLTIEEIEHLKNCPDFVDSTNRTMRYILQTLGTEWGRNTIDERLWINLTKNRIIQHLENSDKNIVISDVRFLNEASMLKTINARLWQVKRFSFHQNLSENEQIHASEKEIESITNTLPVEELLNDHDLAYLELSIQNLH